MQTIRRFYAAEATYLAPGGEDFQAMAAMLDAECVLYQPCPTTGRCAATGSNSVTLTGKIAFPQIARKVVGQAGRFHRSCQFFSRV